MLTIRDKLLESFTEHQDALKPWTDVSLYGNYAEGLSRGQTVSAGYANTGQVLAP